MRFISLLAMTASTALAAQDLYYDEDHSRNLSPYHQVKGRNWCWDKARTPADECYFKSDIYQDKPRTEKLDELMDKILSDNRPANFKWEKLPEFFTQFASGSFCQAADELPRQRTKSTHTQGLVAQVEWIPVANNGYSGMYAEGSETVVMRLSETSNLYDGSSGLTPSVAFKFLIDGQESANIFGMNSFRQSDSWNFFEKPLASRLIVKKEFEKMPADMTDEIMMDTLFKKFAMGSTRPFGTGVAHIADKQNSGEKVKFKDTVAPYELRFKSPLRSRFSEERTSNEWYEEIKNEVKEGEIVYEVYAFTQKSKDGPSSEVKIADILLKTPLYTSRWADEHLYFKHVSTNKDRKFWSQNLRRLDEDVRIGKNNDAENLWGNEVPKNVWPADRDEAEAKYIDQMNQYGCPFAWLLNLN